MNAVVRANLLRGSSSRSSLTGSLRAWTGTGASGTSYDGGKLCGGSAGGGGGGINNGGGGGGWLLNDLGCSGDTVRRYEASAASLLYH